MEQLKEEFLYFWRKKSFAAALVLMTALSFATQLMEPTIGIDDTSFKLYYVDGVSPAMGRWCTYLINKILPLKYNPHFVETVGVCIFALAVSLWCVVFYRVLGERLPFAGYIAFACAMVSSPILTEVEIWYLQDASHLGYFATALSVLVAMNTLREEKLSRKDNWLQILLSGAFLTFALGCYEAFMLVFIIGCLFLFFMIHAMKGEKDVKYTGKVSRWFGSGVAILAISMVLRTLVIKLVTVVFRLEDQRAVLETRDFGDILKLTVGGENGQKGLTDLWFIVKDFFVKYYLHAICYVPIMIFVLAVLVLGTAAVVYTIRRRDGWILLALIGVLLIPLVLSFVEGHASYYRTAHYIPLVTAFAVLLLFWVLRKNRSRIVRYVGYACLFILLYRQGYEMNRWMYVDAMKYEDDKRVMNSVGLYIQENLDASLPICVIGEYENDKSLLEDVYLQDWSKKYTILETLVNGIEPEIFEKYNTPYGYAAAETPQLSMIKWGATAFYGFDRELIAFWKMHGFTFQEDGNLGHYSEAQELMRDGPVWPEKGSIVQTEDYIIVNFGYPDEN